MPDTKDWSWVVRRPCPECGLDASAIARADIPATLTANAAGPRAWRPAASRDWPVTNGCARGVAATALSSRSRRTDGTSSTRRCTTCTT